MRLRSAFRKWSSKPISKGLTKAHPIKYISTVRMSWRGDHEQTVSREEGADPRRPMRGRKRQESISKLVETRVTSGRSGCGMSLAIGMDDPEFLLNRGTERREVAIAE